MNMAHGYSRVTLRQAIDLMGPHTWCASIMPVLLSCALCFRAQGYLPIAMSLILLAICVLLQSAVNVINDYFDYVKGVDDINDNLEPSDAVLLYNRIDPGSVKALAIGLIAVSFLLGIYVIYIAGVAPLAIALIGAAIIYLYSGGKLPISYLPIGEIVSGLVMGSLIPLACYISLAKATLFAADTWSVLLFTIPEVIGIALIMMTNNGSDIEKDIKAKRKTLPSILGRNKTSIIYNSLIAIWVASIFAIVFVFSPDSWIYLVFMLFIAFPLIKNLASNKLDPKARIASMSQICSLNIIMNTFYAFCIIAN